MKRFSGPKSVLGLHLEICICNGYASLIVFVHLCWLKLNQWHSRPAQLKGQSKETCVLAPSSLYVLLEPALKDRPLSESSRRCCSCGSRVSRLRHSKACFVHITIALSNCKV